MPKARLVRDIHSDLGPLAYAQVGRNPMEPPLLGRVFRAPSAPVTVLFLVDTGATRSCLDKAIVTQLALKVRGERLVFTPAEREAKLRNVFAASVRLQGENGDLHDFRALEIYAADFSLRPYKGLLGRDVLNRCNFHYDGPSKKFSLEF